MQFLTRFFSPPPAEDKKPPLRDYLLLLGLGLVFLLAQSLWFSNLEQSLKFFTALNTGIHYFKTFLSHPQFLNPSLSNDYPPLLYWVSGVFYAWGGFSLRLACLSSLVFVFILLFALYGMGFSLGGRFTAWLLVFFTLGNPRFIFWNRFYNGSFSETALTALVLCLIFLSAGFSRKPIAVWSGLALGLAGLTGYSWCYLLLPLSAVYLYLLVQAWKGSKSEIVILSAAGLGAAALAFAAQRLYSSGAFRGLESRYPFLQILGFMLALGLLLIWGKSKKSFSPAANFSLALAAGGLICLPWYFCNLGVILGRFRGLPPLLGSETLALFSLYLNTIVRLFPGIILLLIPGLVFVLYNAKKLNYLVLLCGIIPAAWLLQAGEPNYLHFMPLQGPAVLLALSWLAIIPQVGKRLLLLLAMLWFALNLAGVASSEGNFLPQNSKTLKLTQQFLNLSAYNSPFFVAVTYRDGIGSGRPNLNPPLPGYRASTLPESVMRELARQIAATFHKPPEQGVNLGLLNLEPDFLLYQWQLECHLLFAANLPPRSRLNYIPVNFNFFSETGRNFDGSRPDYLLTISPQAQAPAQLEAKISYLKPFLLGAYPLPNGYIARCYLLK